jgi:hypothetical protein
MMKTPMNSIPGTASEVNTPKHFARPQASRHAWALPTLLLGLDSEAPLRNTPANRDEGTQV